MGTGGRNLQGIQEKTKTRIEIGRDGTVLIMGQQGGDVSAAKKAIENIALDLKKDGLYLAQVTQKKEFGIFVRISDHEGLVHNSEIIGGKSPQHFGDGQEILVRVLGSDTRGRLKLSQKAAEGAQRMSPQCLRAGPKAGSRERATWGPIQQFVQPIEIR